MGPPAVGGPWRTAVPELGAMISALEVPFTTTECMGKLGARGETPTPNHGAALVGYPPRGPAEQPSVRRKGLAIRGIAAMLALATQGCQSGRAPVRTSPGEETQLCVLALQSSCYTVKQNERHSSPSPKHTPFLMRVDPGAMWESRPFPGRLQRH